MTPEPRPEAVLTATSRVATPRASGYLQQLCKHFGHKVPASFDADQGRIAFPFGDCDLSAGEGVLTLRLTAATPEALERLQSVIASHLERFAFREALEIRWDAA